jgi:hypothetical protein
MRAVLTELASEKPGVMVGLTQRFRPAMAPRRVRASH